MSTETNETPTAASSESATPAPGHVPTLPIVQGLIAALVIGILGAGAIWFGATYVGREAEERKVAFENVIVLSQEELEAKSVAELQGYLNDVQKVGSHAGRIYANASGYDKEIVEREHNQINDLIKAKTDI